MNQSKRWPFRPSWEKCFPAIFLLFVLLPSAALGQSRSIRAALPDHGIALLEGVVIAPHQGFAYVMNPRGGIDAVNLANGAVRWHSESGAKPLALTGDRLIAQTESRGADALNLVVLDARSGATREAVRIPLPTGINATVTDTPGSSFRIRAESSASELAVRWEATSITGTAQGYLPAEDEGQAPTVVTGEAILDLSPVLRVRAEPAVRVTRSTSLARAALEEVRELAISAAAGEGRQLLSADGRHVLVTEPVATAELTLNRHRWTVYERGSGARLGSVPAMVSAMPFLVVGKTLYHPAPAHAVRREGGFVEQQAALRAVNLKTGAEMWKVTARETSFKGPFPP